jgi:BolA family transcriptional regulator, general stress-responsive regulator
LNPVAAEIEARLRARFAPSHLEVVDDSAHHVGHAGAAAGGGHYSCLVVSDWFRGRSSLERHRAVYAALGDLMPRTVHALALSTLDPEEWRGAR